jgi:hypothetical protein
MKAHCRNNIGNWPTREVDAPRGARGFDYYSLKDRAMAEAAEYGLMLWDGKSKGTVSNVVNLSRDHKPVVVYVAPTKKFRTIRTSDDLRDLPDQRASPTVDSGRLRRRSPHISRLPAGANARLDTMIEKGFQVLVGDASGGDQAAAVSRRQLVSERPGADRLAADRRVRPRSTRDLQPFDRLRLRADAVRDHPLSAP